MNLEFNPSLSHNTDPKEMMNLKQVTDDIDYLVYSMDHAYSGSKKLPEGKYLRLKNKLNELKFSQTVESLGSRIGELLDEVPDKHLNISFIDSDKKPIKFTPNNKKIISSVGDNVAKGQVWKVEEKVQGNHKTLIIGITSFPLPSSELWDGFEDTIINKIQNKDFVILDLRGNHGGDDSMGGWLANYLNGGDPKLPYADPFDMNTIESFTIFSNLPKIASYFSGRPVEKDGTDFINKLSALSKRVVQGEKVDLRKEFSQDSPQDTTSKKTNAAYPGKIFILIDGYCASSGESTVDFFENIPNVKKIGQNTAGYIHFGNTGFIMLPHSSLIVQMGTSFNTYHDGRFIEKTGIRPDIYVQNGTDALDVVYKIINKNQK